MTMAEGRVSRLEGAYEQVDERLGDLRTEMNARFDEMRADMNARFEDLRTEMSSVRTEMSSVRTEMSALRADMDARFETQRREFNGKFNTMIVVMGTVGAAGVAALGGIAASLVMLALRI